MSITFYKNILMQCATTRYMWNKYTHYPSFNPDMRKFYTFFRTIKFMDGIIVTQYPLRVYKYTK